MKAELVHNTEGVPRIFLMIETQEERDLLANSPTLLPVVTGSTDGVLSDISYAKGKSDPELFDYCKDILDELLRGVMNNHSIEWIKKRCLQGLQELEE